MAVARRHRKAHTLVELMSVLAVIVVLIAFLVPVYGAVREAARTALCANNLHQIGLAAVDHRIENRNRFQLRSITWPGQLAGHVGGQTRLFICPSDDSPATAGPPMAAINVYATDGSFMQSMLFQEGPMVLRTELGENRHRLDFEDIPGGGDTDFNDFIAEITHVPNFGYRIHARRGDALYRFDVVNGDGDIIQSDVDAGGVTFELHGGTSSYGMNQAVDALPNPFRGDATVLMLDYEKISAVVHDDSILRDDWSAWIGASGKPSFARHHGKVNVLGMGGGVRLTSPNDIDPQSASANMSRWLPDYVEP